MTKSFLTSALVIAAALAGMTTPAAAKTGSWQVGNDSYHLYSGDLDMNSRAGRATLLGRVEKIAAKLCETLATDRNACIADTVQQAVRQADGKMLAVAMNERSDRAYASR